MGKTSTRLAFVTSVATHCYELFDHLKVSSIEIWEANLKITSESDKVSFLSPEFCGIYIHWKAVEVVSSQVGIFLVVAFKERQCGFYNFWNIYSHLSESKNSLSCILDGQSG